MGKTVGKVDEFDLEATLDSGAARVRPTCLELDLWDRARGRELLEEGEFGQPLRQLRLSADAVADFHGCAFLPEPALAENGPPVRAGFIEQVFNSADFWELRESTVLDPAASELTALSLARSFRQQFPENNDGEDGQLPEPGDLRGELALMRAVRRAVAEAGEEVGAYREAAAAFGLGEGGGSRRNLETGRMAALFKRVRHNASLRRIAEMAGRLRRYARSKQRQKTRHGYDDMVGVALGDDLGAILSEELALLDSELEPDLLRRYVEAELMQYEYQGIEKKGLGPLFVILDESGSMQGAKNEAAKALALALAWVAKQQNRWCCLVSFSGGRPERPLPLKPSGWDEAALADWVSSFIGGGSELDVPLRELPRWFAELQCPRGKTDLVFVTDGIVSIDQRTREDFLRFKKEWGARAISLVIQADPEPMRPVSDEVHAVRDLSLNEGAIRELMGI